MVFINWIWKFAVTCNCISLRWCGTSQIEHVLYHGNGMLIWSNCTFQLLHYYFQIYIIISGSFREIEFHYCYLIRRIVFITKAKKLILWLSFSTIEFQADPERSVPIFTCTFLSILSQFSKKSAIFWCQNAPMSWLSSLLMFSSSCTRKYL